MRSERHRKPSIFSAYLDELKVTLSSLIGNVGQMWVPLLTVLAYHTAIIVGILSQKVLRAVVAVDVDFSQCIVSGSLFTAFTNLRLQPGKQQFEPLKNVDTVKILKL